MKIQTYSQQNGYDYNGNLVTYFANTPNIDSTLKDGKIWMGDPDKFNDPFDCKMPTYEDILLENTNYSFLKTIGIRCFNIDNSTKDNDQLMWAHYADKGNGISLVFAPNKDSNFFSNNDTIGVIYEREPKRLCLSTSLEEWDENHPDFIQTILYSFGIKSKQWEYENEVRVKKIICSEALSFLGDSMKKINTDSTQKSLSEIEKNKLIKEEYDKKIELYLKQNKDARKKEFKKEALIEVRFGYNMKDTKRIEDIKNILQTHGYQHCICKKAVVDNLSFAIKYEDF